MVEVVEGNLFESGAQTLVNTVNTVGVMGKGVALAFKRRFPEMFDDYLRRTERGQVRLGCPYLYKRPNPPWILNFPTKDHWRSMSRIADIVAGLEFLEAHYRKWGITSLAVPPLGAGQGGLEWHVIGPTLYKHLTRLDIPVKLYVPHGTPHEELRPSFLDRLFDDAQSQEEGAQWTRIGPAWVALIEALARLEAEPYHWPVGHILFQKLAYFGTEARLPTGLVYERGSFGPFASELKRHTSHLINNGLIDERRRGQLMEMRVGSTFQDAKRAFQSDLAEYEPAIERVVDLLARMNAKDAEVAATAHFAAKELYERSGVVPTEAEVLAEVMAWKMRRKPPFHESDVALAIRNLNLLEWLQAKPIADFVSSEDLMGV